MHDLRSKLYLNRHYCGHTDYKHEHAQYHLEKNEKTHLLICLIILY